jgi:acyl-coenzyme A synthetase/AMP-(fatty) acid ligase
MTASFNLAYPDLLGSPSELSDGATTLVLSEAEPVFERLQSALHDAGVTPDACVAIDLRNDVASATLLLFLLARGQGVLLLAPRSARDAPRSARDAPRSARDAPNPVPDYCTHLCASAEPGRVDVVPQSARGSRAQCSNRLYVATSGSTAAPRTAVHESGRLLANARNCLRRFQLVAGDRVCIPVPLLHMYGLGAAFLPAVLAGARVELQAGANVLRFLERERAFEPTVAFLTPAFCHSLLRVRKAPREYRLTVVAGDRMREDAFRAYEARHGCLLSLYGSTELGAIAAGAPGDSPKQRSQSTGRLMPGVELASPLQRGRQGAACAGAELCFSHDSACLGYANADGEPVASGLMEDAVYHTRDLGGLDADGYLQVTGRIDHTVNRDGLLVAFSAVEKALSRLEAIEEVVVVSLGQTPRGGQLTAVCVSGGADAPVAAGARRLAATCLPSYAVPDEFVWLAELPRLPSGKPDRRAIRDSLAHAAAGQAPRTGAERT